MPTSQRPFIGGPKRHFLGTGAHRVEPFKTSGFKSHLSTRETQESAEQDKPFHSHPCSAVRRPFIGGAEWHFPRIGVDGVGPFKTSGFVSQTSHRVAWETVDKHTKTKTKCLPPCSSVRTV